MARIANATLSAIEAALVKDQGATFRTLLGKHITSAGDAFRGESSPFRAHLGASLIGRECTRELWYSFHWATKNVFGGRMHRLFNRGHLEEPRFVALLEMIGCTVWQVDAQGKQFRVEGHRGHFGGSIDAVISGLPEMGTAPVLGEFKTHGDKSFKKLLDEGVQSAKWEHFVQMQTYMGKLKLPAALYMAVNKNDDDLYAEIVMFDQAVYERYQQRSVIVIDAVEAPKRINQSPGWFKCKFCDHKAVCHGTALPERNCRTCVHVKVGDNKTWTCTAHGRDLSEEDQLAGCPTYVMNPEMKATL